MTSIESAILYRVLACWLLAFIICVPRSALADPLNEQELHQWAQELDPEVAITVSGSTAGRRLQQSQDLRDFFVQLPPSSQKALLSGCAIEPFADATLRDICLKLDPERQAELLREVRKYYSRISTLIVPAGLAGLSAIVGALSSTGLGAYFGGFSGRIATGAALGALTGATAGLLVAAPVAAIWALLAPSNRDVLRRVATRIAERSPHGSTRPPAPAPISADDGRPSFESVELTR